MTVSTSTYKAGPYAGAGLTGPFTVPFRFLAASHLRVIKTSAANVDTTLTLTTDYTVAGVGLDTGSVTLTTPLAVGERLTVVRSVPLTQEADYVNNDSFPAESHETALDKLTMITQQLQERVDSSLTLSPTAPGGTSLTLPDPQARALIGWNALGNGLTNYSPETIAVTVAYASAYADLFNGDGVLKSFALSAAPGTTANMDVSIAGVTQLPGDDFTLAGSVITFVDAPPAGTRVLVRYAQALAIGTANANDVTFTQPSGGAVATTVAAKLSEQLSAFDFMTPSERASVRARDGSVDVTLALQRFLDACRGRRGWIPAGRYPISAQLVLDPVHSYCIEGDGWNSENGPDQGTSIEVTNGSNGLFIYYNNANFPGGPAGATPSALPNSDNRVRIARLAIRGPANYATPGTQQIGIEGTPTLVATGNAIYAYWVQGLELEDVWTDGFSGDGLYGYRCFSIVLRNAWFVKHGGCGIHLYRTANAVDIRGVKALVNCLRPTKPLGLAATSANILIDADNNYECLGFTISGPCDVSYPGGDGPWTRTRRGGTLTNIVVSGGVATATVTGLNRWTAGDKLAVWGAIGGEVAINTVDAPAVVTSVTGTTVVFPTSAPNGTYTGTDLAISPWAAGIATDWAQGVSIEAYAEDTTGPGLWIGGNVRGFLVHGGYWQDARHLIETGARGGVIFGCAYAGLRSGLYMRNAVSAVVFANRYEQLGTRGRATATIFDGSGNAIATPESGLGLSQFPGGVGSMLVQGMVIGRGAQEGLTNTALGVRAHNNIDTTNPSLALNNTTVGFYTSDGVTTGYSLTRVGYDAGRGITTGFQCVVVGARALENSPNAQNVVAVGFGAGRNILSGGADVYVGTAAGQTGATVASGSDNTFVGNQAGRQTGGQVIAQSTILGGQGTLLGLSGPLSNFIGIGFGSQADAFRGDNRTVIGNSTTTRAKIYGAVVLGDAVSVSALPGAAAELNGARAFVIDANSAAFNAIAVGGGSNRVPVFCDGTTWRVG